MSEQTSGLEYNPNKFELVDDPRRMSHDVGEAKARILDLLPKMDREQKRDFVFKMIWNIPDKERDRSILGKDPQNSVLNSQVAWLAFCQKEVVAQCIPEIVEAVNAPGQTLRSALDDHFYDSAWRSWYKQDQVLIVPEVINPITKLWIDRKLKPDNLRSLNPWYRESCLVQDATALAFVMGYFDDDETTRRMGIEKAEITPFFDEYSEYPVLKEIIGVHDLNRSDSQRLRRLKKFWGKVFVQYWTSVVRTEGGNWVWNREPDSAISRKMPPEPSDSFPKDQARALSLAIYQAKRQALLREIEAIISAYRGSAIPMEVIKSAFNKNTSEKIFGLLAGRKEANPQELAEFVAKAEKILPKNHLEKIFGPDYPNLDPIEKTSLIAFTAFASNGMLVKSSQRAVGFIQRYLLPTLERHADLKPKRPDSQSSYVPPKLTIAEVEEALGFNFDTKPELVRTESKGQILMMNDPLIVRESLETKDKLKKALNIARTVYEKLDPKISKQLTLLKTMCIVIGAVAMGIGLSELEKKAGAGSMVLLMSSITWTALWRWSLFNDPRVSEVLQLRNKIRVRRPDVDKQIEGIKKEKDEIFSWNTRNITIRSVLALALGVQLFIAANGPERMSEKLKDVSNLSAAIGEFIAEKSGIKLVGNSGESPALGEADFIIEANREKLPQRLFWLKDICVTGPDDRNISCQSYTVARSGANPIFVDSVSELDRVTTLIKENGMMIRFNMDDSPDFQTPIGYWLAGVVLYSPKEGEVQVSGSPYDGLIAKASDSDSPAKVGLVYAPSNELEVSNNFLNVDLPWFGFSETDRGSESWQSAFEKGELPGNVTGIYQWARQAKEENLLDNEQILQGIKDRISALGVDYGLQLFISLPFQKSQDTLANLFASDVTGKMLVREWICNQFSFATYAIARGAGLEVYLAEGNVQYPAQTNLGGYSAYNHAVVLYLDSSSGHLKLFEATLPDVNGDSSLPIPPETQADISDFLPEGGEIEIGKAVTEFIGNDVGLKREALNYLLLGGLALSGAGAIAAAANSRQGRAFIAELKKDQITKIIDKGGERLAIAAWEGVRNLAEFFDTPETDQLAGSKLEYARWVARDMISLCETGTYAGLSVKDLKEMILREKHSIKVHSDTYWDPEKVTRLREASPHVIKYIKERMRDRLDKDQRENLGRLKSLFETMTKGTR